MEDHFSGNMKPYNDEKISESCYERIFKYDVDTDEMVWHRDKKSREITILEGDGWMLQLDNSLPFELYVGDTLCIPEMLYHRIYRIGSNNLKIKICE